MTRTADDVTFDLRMVRAQKQRIDQLRQIRRDEAASLSRQAEELMVQIATLERELLLLAPTEGAPV